MLPKKLFCPKCLHPDRDLVFKEDLDMLFNHILSQMNINSIQSERNRISELRYERYKMYYNAKRMSMIHFSRSKEENAKEYNEVLFGEIQNFLFMPSEFKYIHKIYSIFTLYSVYFTQTSHTLYQINTIPDYLSEINAFIKSFAVVNRKIAQEMYLMVDKLYRVNAFSIGILTGLKTIILNKYGLPIEQKANVFKDSSDLYDYSKQRKGEANNPKPQDTESNKLLLDYFQLKQDIVKSIKELDFNQEIYCNFLNKTLLAPNNANINSKDNYEANDLDIMPLLQKTDFDPHKVTNLDCLFSNII